jgi:uncharacterized protein YqiB (DUF1249 family)
MVTFSQPNGLTTRPSLGGLQSVQEEIYRQLQLLIPDHFSFHDHMKSDVSGSPLLRLEVLERHAYTTFFRLTYEFREAAKRRYAPEAHIRFYHDARIAEATSFSLDQGCARMAHPCIPPKQLAQRAWRENKALDRWLDYLLRQGHSVESMKPARQGAGHETPVKTLVTAG